MSQRIGKRFITASIQLIYGCYLDNVDEKSYEFINFSLERMIEDQVIIDHYEADVSGGYSINPDKKFLLKKENKYLDSIIDKFKIYSLLK